MCLGLNWSLPLFTILVGIYVGLSSFNKWFFFIFHEAICLHYCQGTNDLGKYFLILI